MSRQAKENGPGTQCASRHSLGSVAKNICLRRGSKNNAPHNNEVRVLGAAACRWWR